MHTKQNNILTAKNVTYRYYEQSKRNILEDAEFKLKKGKITVMLGRSGCGKSTLAAIMAGLLPANGGVLSQGEILFDGVDLQKLSPHQRVKYISMMFQNCDLQFCMNTLREELRFCLENISVPGEKMDGIIEAVIEKTGMRDLLDRKLQTLSGGEKQKAALCCILALGSKCIILDEPFANIDSDSSRELIALLSEFNRESKITILAIDHKLDRWLDVADEIVIMGEKGKILESGITKENLSKAKKLFKDSGIYFPGEQSRRYLPRQSTDNAITIRDLCVDKYDSHTKKILTLFKKRASPGLTQNDKLFFNAKADFPQCAITAILGKSGIGKTTLFQTLLGQIRYSGSIMLGQDEISRLSNKKLFSKIGIVLQNPANQFISQCVFDEVLLSLKFWNKNQTQEWYNAKTTELLKAFELEKYHKYSPYMLSQGQQRRLAVLSMIAGGQQILLLDEPTYGQDYGSTVAIMEQLTERVIRDGLTVIFSTHDISLAENWADAIFLIEDKKLKRQSLNTSKVSEGVI